MRRARQEFAWAVTAALGIATIASADASAPPAPATMAAAPEAEVAAETQGFHVDWGLEGRVNFRDTQELRVQSPFPFPPNFLPPGQTHGFMETADQGSHFETSLLALNADASWGPAVRARARVEFLSLYNRNPTSSGAKVDVRELWIRFGSDPSAMPRSFGVFLEAGKFAKFERQNDRHLESYGLCSTAFNRFEDQGVALGVDLGQHFYLRGAATTGNPLFFRDPNALAGDNGAPDDNPITHPNPNPVVKSGFPIFYDAHVEGFSTNGGHLQSSGWLGARFGDRDEGTYLEILAFAHRRKLADRVTLDGTFYGGDLTILAGPSGAASLPIRGDEKREAGGNLWLYHGGLSLFGQYVDQRIAGLKRTGYEGELAWRFDLPLTWATGGRQLFPSIAPAIRYSDLHPYFAGPSTQYPAASVRWLWTKIDYGVRIAILDAIDLTAEYSANTMTLASGRKVHENEYLTTLRIRVGAAH